MSQLNNRAIQKQNYLEYIPSLPICAWMTSGYKVAVRY